MSEPTTTVETHGTSAIVDTAIAGELGGDGKLTRGGASWSLFEGARNPYIILVTIYMFSPYVASIMVGDPVKGQAVISQWSQYQGWIVMATAPLLGASIDQLGRRKLWLGLAACIGRRGSRGRCHRRRVIGGRGGRSAGRILICHCVVFLFSGHSPRCGSGPGW